jgi:hypothetical protein
MGQISVIVSDILGKDLPAKVELQGPGSLFFIMQAPQGKAEGSFPPADYKAYISVYSEGVPIVVDIQDVDLAPGGSKFVLVNLLEGAAGTMALWQFDQDFDLVLDRVEENHGTDPGNPSSTPGKRRLRYENKVLSKEARWYRGELYAHSEYHQTPAGNGTESVKSLISRAEKLNLDFLAIADRNTLAAIDDPDYKSKKLVLIPALEWGTDENGIALVYAPGTLPELVASHEEAQAITRLIQAQGGVFVAAHPCFPGSIWQWGISHVNGMQVWCRDWRGVAGVALTDLKAELRMRLPDQGGLKYSIARAVSGTHNQLSANAQAARFWDNELNDGLRASVYGGSSTSTPNVPMAQPITYVYAKEKSLEGIVEGMRNGHTFVSSGPKGPTIMFGADVLNDDEMDVGVGGLVPIGVETKFQVSVEGAKDAKLEVLQDGQIILSKIIESNRFVHQFVDTPKEDTVYRARVISAVEESGFGSSNILALTSPIYVQKLFFETDKLSKHDMWIRLQQGEDVQLETPPDNPNAPNVKTLVPKWTF